jgi:predicted transport protein
VQPDLFGGVLLMKEWGRIGAQGRMMAERYDGEAPALVALQKQAERKRRRGYTDICSSIFSRLIIRTIEYWDIERKRYPQYEHCAVLIAEDITSRFLNVVSLFNGTIPLIALQMQALKVGTHTTLVFTKVMDELSRGMVDEDEDAEAAPTDRAYWEKRGTKATVQLADELLAIAREIDPSLELKYNKFYIGFSKEGQPFNFAIFRPRKSTINFEVKLPRAEEIDTKIDQAGIEALEYATRWGQYRLSLHKADIAKHRELLKGLMQAAYQNRST